MELKFIIDIFVFNAKLRFNRTFMELKFKNTLTELVRSTVLIVPLWNWNKEL